MDLFSLSPVRKTNNTKITTKTELVAVDDCRLHSIWIQGFLLEQGYQKAETVVRLQDNQSEILFQQTGIMASTTRTKQLKVRYFFVKNKMDSKGVRVEGCHTNKMVA